MFRYLTEERGAWSVVPFPSNCQKWWKLDKTEDPWRRRLKLRRNYHFNQEFQRSLSSGPSARNWDATAGAEKGYGTEILGGDVRTFLLKGLRGVSEEELTEPSEDEIKDASGELADTQVQSRASEAQVLAEVEQQDVSLQSEQPSKRLDVAEDEVTVLSHSSHLLIPAAKCSTAFFLAELTVLTFLQVLLSVSCVLITSKRKLAGRLDILQSSIHFFGEFLVEGNGGSSIFTVSGGLKKSDGNSTEAGEKSSRRTTKVLRNTENWIADIEKDPLDRSESTEDGLANVKRHRRWDVSQVRVCLVSAAKSGVLCMVTCI